MKKDEIKVGETYLFKHRTEEVLEDFKLRHGYDWPNCSVPDCENKACVPSIYCHPHTIDVLGYDPRP